MFYLKNLCFKNNRTNTIDTNFIIQNPLIQESSDNFKIITEYLRLKHLSLDQLLDWKCPICLESIDSGISITFPFKCSHSICLSCLRNWCKCLFSRTYQKSVKNIKCCLCRKTPDIFWIESYNIYSLVINYKGKDISIVFPSQLDHRYPFRKQAITN